jgi:DNA-binding transcriptional MerR regulator
MQTIGQAAKATGVKIPTIRFYEQEGLLAAPERTESGRRLYGTADMKRLTFIRHARALGFELDDIRSLLDLSDHPQRSCEAADEIARRHLADVKIRMAQLRALETELARIVASCAGGKAAECRVIDALAHHAHCASEHAAPEPRKKSAAHRRDAKARRAKVRR